jgi:hypothetical protein
MRGKIQILTVSCRRCDKQLATASRSLFGADAAKARLDRICEGCATPEERREMLTLQADAILRR